MKENEQISLFEVLADYFDIDEAEVIDNCDNETITVCGCVYQIIDLEEPIRMDGITYYWALFEIKPF